MSWYTSIPGHKCYVSVADPSNLLGNWHREIPDKETRFTAMFVQSGGQQMRSAIVRVPRNAIARARVSRDQLRAHQGTFHASLLEGRENDAAVGAT